MALESCCSVGVDDVVRGVESLYGVSVSDHAYLKLLELILM